MTKKQAEMSDQEYIEILEEQLEIFMLAIIIDMKKHGIFEEVKGEFRVTAKFFDDVQKQIVPPISDPDDAIDNAIINTMQQYYDNTLIDFEETYARANILTGYMYDELIGQIR